MVDDILVWLPLLRVYTQRARAATATCGLVAGRSMSFTNVAYCSWAA
jgi:hypothetical protein